MPQSAPNDLRRAGLSPTLKMIELKDLPKLPQRQDPVAAQLADLRDVANRLGLYDAADALRQTFGDTMALAENRLRHGCHCDLEDHQEPDGCVIDEGRPQDCIYAAEAGRKERCEYWQIVVPNDGAKA